MHDLLMLVVCELIIMPAFNANVSNWWYDDSIKKPRLAAVIRNVRDML